MNIKQWIVALVLVPSMFTACSEDFLDETNPNNSTPGNYWLSQENVMKGLAATYNPIRRMTYGYYGGFDGVLHNQMRADDCYPTRGEEAPQWAVNSFTNTPETGISMWDYIYTGIQIANEFIYNAPKVEDMEEDALNQVLAEAHFLRGFWYFRVATDFREGVLRTLPYEHDPVQHGLSSQEDILKQAIADFQEAKKYLPETRPASEYGRVTKGAAEAMLGKASIWAKDYATAKTELEAVMNSGYYDLMPNFEDNFRDDTEFNQESIWEINYDAQYGSASEWGSTDEDNSLQGSVIAHYFGPSVEGPGATGQNIGGGWYKLQPSPYLIKQFIAEPRPAGSDSKWDKRMYTTCFFKYSDYGDVKADETWFDGFGFDELFTATVLPEGAGKYGIGNFRTSPAYPDINGKEGRFLFKKLTCWWNPTGCTMYSNKAAMNTNFRIMRFAEVLFLHAEACLETGDVASAMADINRIRVRAGLPEKNLSGKDAVMEELRNQKLLEFAGENVRWDDLVRWYSYDELKRIMVERKTDSMNYNLQYATNADGEEELVGYEKTGVITETQGFTSNFQAKHMYLPIPQAEVDSNEALEQKADWQ